MTATATLRRERLRTIVAISIALGLLVAVQALYFTRGLVPGDALVYLAAGERLNAGHDLYALSPGDRSVGLKPPYWTVPLLSPPLIAVVWRPLAALPNELGVGLWWALTIGAIALSMGLLLRRRPMATSAAIVVLVVPLVYEIGVGNVSGLLLLSTIGTWWLVRNGRDRPAGALIGLMAAVKLTPLVFAWWLLTGRRWRALGGAVAGGAIALVVSLLGAGLDAHVRYLEIVRQTNTTGASDLSLAGLSRGLGVPEAIAAFLPLAGIVVGSTAVFLLRGRPGAAFAAAVATAVLGSPVVNINWYAFLLAALAPSAWPLNRKADARAHIR